MFALLLTTNIHSDTILVRTNVLGERFVQEVYMMRKMRIASKFRFTIFMVIVLLTVFTAASTIAGFNTANSLSMDQYRCVEIESGDTLWSIAAEYAPDNQDVRQVVHDICETNDIQANDIASGQKILVPVYN